MGPHPAGDGVRAGDSAGTPWAGRQFDANAFAGDDGSADPALDAALRGFAAGSAGQAQVVDALRGARLLIPLIAHAGETGLTADGRVVDKTQELSIVTVAGPDGRAVLPVFSRVATMTAWNPAARPVPAEGVRVALAAAAERTELVVVDPTADTEFAVRRPAVSAIAQGLPWRPGFEGAAVAAAFRASVAQEPAVTDLTLEPGDPAARLAGPEVVVRLTLVAGLDREELDAVLRRLTTRWVADEAIAAGVDSLAVRLAAASG